MNLAYGPVPSRRFGRSIGVSPIPPKTCSYSCVYCQLGLTNPQIAERRRFFKPDKILDDLKNSVEASSGKVDFITYVGDGEPTLCSDLGNLIEETKNQWDIPVSVITNGSLLWIEKLREELAQVDVVSVTVSAGDNETYKKVHRPHDSLSFERVIDGNTDFGHHYSGKLWAEVMLVSGLNDSDESLAALKENLDTISADKIWLATPTRPPAESWVEPPDAEKIIAAAKRLGASLEMTRPETGDIGLDGFTDAGEAIREISSRHPLRLEQVREIERHFTNDVIDHFLEQGTARMVEYMGIKYIIPTR
jgi:wyosine [tRNA(Phe)-imidazoG37] synthetase (radical SAM superfamily)